MKALASRGLKWCRREGRRESSNKVFSWRFLNQKSCLVKLTTRPQRILEERPWHRARIGSSRKPEPGTTGDSPKPGKMSVGKLLYLPLLDFRSYVVIHN